MGYFCKVPCSQELSKISQSGHTAQLTKVINRDRGASLFFFDLYKLPPTQKMVPLLELASKLTCNGSWMKLAPENINYRAREREREYMCDGGLDRERENVATRDYFSFNYHESFPQRECRLTERSKLEKIKREKESEWESENDHQKSCSQPKLRVGSSINRLLQCFLAYTFINTQKSSLPDIVPSSIICLSLCWSSIIPLCVNVFV